MTYIQNLHTHSTYCDGKDTPRQMVESALAQGFTSIGFSGHSYMHYAPDHSMSQEGTKAYIREVNALKTAYADRLDVYCGIEYDFYSDLDISAFDYAIGSVHYFRFGNEYVGFDRSATVVKNVIDTYFGGDGLAYAKAYYATLARLPEMGHFDIIGHFDLLTKHSEQVPFFDDHAPAYLAAATEAAEALAGKIPFFEVNTGAIARGYRTTPYPALPILKELRRRGFGAVISSDCHDATHLACGFHQAASLLQAAGFTERYILTATGFAAVAL